MNPLQMLTSMGNPNQIIQFLAKSNPQVSQMMSILQNNKNPMQILQNQFGNNPTFQQALKIAEGKDSNQLKSFVNNILNNNIQQ